MLKGQLVHKFFLHCYYKAILWLNRQLDFIGTLRTNRNLKPVNGKLMRLNSNKNMDCPKCSAGGRAA